MGGLWTLKENGRSMGVWLKEESERYLFLHRMASSALAEMGLSVTSRRASPHTPAAATAPSPGPLGGH